MIYSLCVTANPLAPAHFTAIQFCQALITKGHQINQVFFYQDAVNIGSMLLSPAQDEFQTQQAWLELQNQGVNLSICIAAAIRRGVLDENEAKRYEKDSFNLHPDFIITGLGEFISLSEQADKQVCFG